MTSVRESTISGFNEYLETLKKDNKSKYEFTLTLFDTEVIRPVIAKDIKKVSGLTKESYDPNGSTALYDAVCSTIRETKEDKDQKVITIIMTDGEENSSKEYTQVEMKRLIQEREAKGNWKFVYLGANQDSYAVAQKYGINANAIVNFMATNAGMTRAMNTMSAATMSYSSEAQSNIVDFFSENQKKDIEKGKK